MLNDDLAALGGCLLADGQQQAQAGTADVLQGGAVEGDVLVGILQQWKDFLLCSDGCGGVEPAVHCGVQASVLFLYFENHSSNVLFICKITKFLRYSKSFDDNFD